ncbi:hypothetical protein [Sinorhizobium meliloti]|uniref:DUF7678 domain-containing protein n=1 Tax=Rhizobium meliloti TaxID=382 RepID=UPI0019122420|nr:hypothetical protein [Sinorhizobium meliloti]
METGPIVDTDRITINKGDAKNDLWVSGTINETPAYSFTAKVFDVGSKYGLDGGQISKLTVWHDGNEVASYDRGWDNQPQTDADKRAVEIIKTSFAEREQTQSPDTIRIDLQWRRATGRGRNADDTGRER